MAEIKLKEPGYGSSEMPAYGKSRLSVGSCEPQKASEQDNAITLELSSS